ncbi:methyltransferase domain-containing protein [Solirubrobacter sp. CPCC 204708]|uniref:Class I SAM-dependent methyltransferase n=1 Tax=Solirubrobacter deserti TaxID=2282478 RepID=A0ABT4RII6_9ACTN|nr:class I SAM-dependent methyltransferase [Solirubrobacter deserti]MBE2320246.1 methyltransferase domain-containing protein [Solirubrobacter deserti]MDA0138368.1 class I SAM-dependent methyltransferase [Solirubrobacter deserti]
MSCPVCKRPADAPFVHIAGVPVHVSQLHTTPSGARTARRGDLQLAFCAGCGFIWNVAFDAALVEYDAAYENSLDHSRAFTDYANGLAQRLVERYDVRGRRVAEIGCGQAEFLRALCNAGHNRGFGYDPTYVGDDSDPRITIRRELYSEETVGDLEPEFVCCRHVLEHLEQPLAFVRSLRRTLSAERAATVYVEVPNGTHQLLNGVVWDMIYAHYATYTEPSLRTLFELGGFEILDSGAAFGDQYLWLEARPTDAPVPDAPSADLDAVRAAVERFAAGYSGFVGDWRRRVDGLRTQGRRVVLWGAGAKGVSLLNSLEDHDAIARVVDVNPRKHGTYVPGAGTPVVSPEALRAFSPDVVVLANPIYRDEVRGILAELGQSAEILCV